MATPNQRTMNEQEKSGCLFGGIAGIIAVVGGTFSMVWVAKADYSTSAILALSVICALGVWFEHKIARRYKYDSSFFQASFYIVAIVCTIAMTFFAENGAREMKEAQEKQILDSVAAKRALKHQH